MFRAAARDGKTIGIGDGASVSAATDALDEAVTPVAAVVVPLCGGYWSTGPEREPYRRVAEALGAQPHGLMAPGLVDDAATRKALIGHAGVRAVIDLWDHLDIALFGIGGPAWSVALVGRRIERDLDAGRGHRRGARRPVRHRRALRLPGPARSGDRVRCPATRPRPGRDRDGRRARARSGRSSGALRAGVVKTLVTDVATAEAVVALDDTTAPDRAGRSR